MNRHKYSIIAFYIAMFLELVVSFSGYLFGGYNEKMLIFAGMGMSSLAIMLSYDYKNIFKKKGLITTGIYAAFLLYGLICFYYQNTMLVMRVVLPLIAARCVIVANENISIDADDKFLVKLRKKTFSANELPQNVLKIFFYGTLITMIFAGVMSACGLYNTLSLTEVFRHVPEKRYCFGFYHPNGFAFFYFRVAMLGMYLYVKKLPAWLVPIVAAIGVIPLVLANSKMAIAGYAMVAVLVVIARTFKSKKVNTLLLIMVSFIILCVYAVVLASPHFWEIVGRGDKISELWCKFNDELLSGRLYGMVHMYETYSITPFGHKLGIDTTENGFINSLYAEGLVFQIIFLALVVITLVKKYKKQDRYAMIFIAGMFAYNFAESFMQYFNKNLIWMMML